VITTTGPKLTPIMTPAPPAGAPPRRL